MKTLVTGAAGFVGQQLLVHNPNFIGVDLRYQECAGAFCDVRNPEELIRLIRKFKIDKIVHLAGVQYLDYVPKKEREDFFSSNIEMAKALHFAACQTNVKRIIYISTDMVYGSRVVSPVDENQETCPIGEYGKSKLLSERILGDESRTYSICILRPRLILGRGRQGSIAKLVRLINSPWPILLIGNGQNRYQFVSVEDVCEVVIKMLDRETEGVFNIGSENPPRVTELFEVTLRNLGIKKPIIKIPPFLAFGILNLLDKAGLSPLAPEQFKIANIDYVLNTTKLSRELNWRARSNDSDLLTEAIAFLR